MFFNVNHESQYKYCPISSFIHLHKAIQGKGRCKRHGVKRGGVDELVLFLYRLVVTLMAYLGILHSLRLQ